MKTRGEWFVIRGKSGESPELHGESGKIAILFSVSQARQIAQEHNAHCELINACKCALWSLESTGRDVCTDGTETKPARLLRDALKSAGEGEFVNRGLPAVRAEISRRSAL